MDHRYYETLPCAFGAAIRHWCQAHHRSQEILLCYDLKYLEKSWSE